jgi:hypothetical protein
MLKALVFRQSVSTRQTKKLFPFANLQCTRLSLCNNLQSRLIKIGSSSLEQLRYCPYYCFCKKKKKKLKIQKFCKKNRLSMHRGMLKRWEVCSILINIVIVLTLKLCIQKRCLVCVCFLNTFAFLLCPTCKWTFWTHKRQKMSNRSKLCKSLKKQALEHGRMREAEFPTCFTNERCGTLKCLQNMFSISSKDKWPSSSKSNWMNKFSSSLFLASSLIFIFLKKQKCLRKWFLNRNGAGYGRQKLTFINLGVFGRSNRIGVKGLVRFIELRPDIGVLMSAIRRSVA